MPDATSTLDVAVAPSNIGGRPSVKTPENRALIIAEVRAGAPKSCQSIVGRSTLAEWENEDPTLTEEIEAAERAWFEERRKAIERSSSPMGGHDWRADAWLLERRARKLYGKPDTAQGSVTVNNTANITIQISPEQLADLQARRRAATEGLMNGRN